MTDIKLYGSPDDIAIIGMSGRFPGARNIAEFWENLRDGKESVSFFSDEELKGIDPSLLNDPSYVKAGGVLEGVDLFDAAFFGINPREAEVMDPHVFAVRMGSARRRGLQRRGLSGDGRRLCGHEHELVPGASPVQRGISEFIRPLSDSDLE